MVINIAKLGSEHGMAKHAIQQRKEDERKVLAELRKNSNQQMDTIAAHCGFSRQKVCRIIKELEEKQVIWGYTAVFDETQIGLQHFTLMIKRTAKEVEDATAERIISRQLLERGKEYEATIESSAYVHGEYDWIVTFTAPDISHAKRFSDSLVRLYPGLIEKITIVQTLLFIRKNYIVSPNIGRLKELL